MLEGYKTYPGPGHRKRSSPAPVPVQRYQHHPPSGRELPRPPAIPPPDYMEAIRAR